MKELIILSIFIGIFFIILENLFSKRIISKKVQYNSYKINIIVLIFNNILSFVFSLTSLYLIAQNYSSFGLFSSLPQSIFKTVFLVIFLDFIIYIWHIANHKFKFLWLFHKAHHSDLSLNTLTGIRFHFGELFLSILVKSSLIFIFGIPVEVILISETLIIIFSLFQHSNISFKFEKVLSKIIIVPYLHEVHHSSKRIEHDSNYGVIFSIWDRVFKTKKTTRTKPIGLMNISDKNFFEFFKFGFKWKY